MIISVFDRVENVGKGEIACTSNFSFSHNVFKRLLSKTRQKMSLCGNGLKITKKGFDIILKSSIRTRTITSAHDLLPFLDGTEQYREEHNFIQTCT